VKAACNCTRRGCRGHKAVVWVLSDARVAIWRLGPLSEQNVMWGFGVDCCIALRHQEPQSHMQLSPNQRAAAREIVVIAGTVVPRTLEQNQRLSQCSA
jgi:hypothetical protein